MRLGLILRFTTDRDIAREIKNFNLEMERRDKIAFKTMADIVLAIMFHSYWKYFLSV
ncbi:hypothetical protein OIDMADRAFT_17922 [Oidiodendron maius Zn]|uniref:Uncharacterized protein n=1 Tax=Oidiodendron maius (strain Zn) TaxID=913774 RepID=A0A0C3H5N7_OIDMZ|nr:hypothetical protein OIDMADRAFT_17922 [Oidiodendron maius Zn]